ncbi:putative Transmembrane protein [Melia azedarach]|uniref:Transmembrane protein n=1 Tax=Melia azedarach TaxID=155640 RepID=A0ACC1XEY6_MELAZ|nr:putative Transmembrane protein [Melia azedarach]
MKIFALRGSGHVYIDEPWQRSNSSLRRRRSRRSIVNLFSWSELTSGKSVVKLWDNLGLGLGLKVEEISDREFTIYDMNNDREIRKIASSFGRKDEIPAFVSTSSSSPAVIFSAAANDSGHVTLSGWDTRIGSKLPTILAEWRPKHGNIVKVKTGGIEKVYVRDNALTVGDYEEG